VRGFLLSCELHFHRNSWMENSFIH
jgi:hypothetical protein